MADARIILAEARDIRFIFETVLFELRRNENADINLLRRYNKSTINLIGLPPAIPLETKISQWNGFYCGFLGDLSSTARK